MVNDYTQRPIKAVTRRYWTDADRLTMVSNLMETASMILHGVLDRNANLSHIRDVANMYHAESESMLDYAKWLETHET